MEKEDQESKDTIENGKDKVESKVLLIVRHAANDEAHVTQSISEDQGPVHVLGRSPLNLVRS